MCAAAPGRAEQQATLWNLCIWCNFVCFSLPFFISLVVVIPFVVVVLDSDYSRWYFCKLDAPCRHSMYFCLYGLLRLCNSLLNHGWSSEVVAVLRIGVRQSSPPSAGRHKTSKPTYGLLVGQPAQGASVPDFRENSCATNARLLKMFNIRTTSCRLQQANIPLNYPRYSNHVSPRHYTCVKCVLLLLLIIFDLYEFLPVIVTN